MLLTSTPPTLILLALSSPEGPKLVDTTFAIMAQALEFASRTSVGHQQ
jgi:hypothetical protein